MELQIQDLVSAIKKEGVDAARTKADEILAEAEEKALARIAEAEKKAAEILAKAEKEIETRKESAKTAVEHARRDAMLFFKKSLQTEFENVLAADTAKIVREETLAKLIIAAMRDENAADYMAEVAEVTEGLRGELKKALEEGLVIKANPNIRTGFRLTLRDGSGYFDCSDEELEKILMPFFPKFEL